jgi:hypothetical protein
MRDVTLYFFIAIGITKINEGCNPLFLIANGIIKINEGRSPALFVAKY